MRKLEDLQFIGRNKKTGEEFQFRFEDLYGYEGEENGILLTEPNICISYNSGYASLGLNPDLEIWLLDEYGKSEIS